MDNQTKREEAELFFKQHNTRYVLAQFVDIHGAAKAKAVPVEHLDMVLTEGAGFAAFAVWGFGIGPEGPDYMAVGDLSTLQDIPWMAGYARIVCNGVVNKKPHPYCSRVALQTQLQRLSARGMALFTGIEPEFMLLTRSAEGAPAPADATDTLDKPCYDYKGLYRAREVLDEIVAALRSVGIDVYQIDHEDGNGQFEINYTYDHALKTADSFIFTKMAASEIAHKHGMTATFMPKPFWNRAGSGAHFHVSIGTAAAKNAFQDPSDPTGMGLSTLARQFLAGVLAHARAICAVAAPTVNSYKRLVVGRSLSGATWAPAYIAYGDNNRTACVRIPYGRLEIRLPDAGCNPYLVTAALIAAGLDGIDRNLDPGPAHNINLYELSPEELAHKGIKLLPQSLQEAIDALEQDAVVCGGLGADFAAEFIRIKRMEWTEYSRHVSEWEVRRYLEFF
jgi:glutamine synthetase